MEFETLLLIIIVVLLLAIITRFADLLPSVKNLRMEVSLLKSEITRLANALAEMAAKSKKEEPPPPQHIPAAPVFEAPIKPLEHKPMPPVETTPAAPPVEFAPLYIQEKIVVPAEEASPQRVAPPSRTAVHTNAATRTLV